MPGRAWRPQVQGRHSFTVRNGGGERNRRAAVAARFRRRTGPKRRSEEHTSELQSLMRISYAVFCLKKKKINEQKSVTALQHTQKTQNNCIYIDNNKVYITHITNQK